MIEESPSHSARRIYKRLLHALESARTRLVVAIATESKTTPPGLRRSYRETEDRMRRCLKALKSYQQPDSSEQQVWLQVLEALQRLPSPPDPSTQRGEAENLSQQLCEVLTQLESTKHTSGTMGRM